MNRNRRNSRGGILAETVAGMALVLPIMVVVIFVSLEAGYAFVITRSMNEGANLAARSLANEYLSNKNIDTDTTAQQAIFSNIRIPQMIHANSQFEIVAWNTTQVPKTVTVRVSYLSGAGTPALPPFPNPDFLGLGNAFVIKSAATYRLVE